MVVNFYKMALDKIFLYILFYVQFEWLMTFLLIFFINKMAKVHVCNVLVLDNPAQFMTKLEFEITFECIEDLPEDLEWKIIYVGSAESEEFDQILDTVYVSNI